MDRTKYMSESEVKSLRQITADRAAADLLKGRLAGPRTWLIVDIALRTGLRVSELAAIQVEDIDLKRNFIKVSRLKKKKKAVESLNICDGLVKHLRDYLNGRTGGALFIGERGPLKSSGLQQAWKSAIRRANLPKEYSIHCARHTLATMLLKESGNLRKVQIRLGHSSPTTTANMYADVTDEDMLESLSKLYQ